MISIVVLIQFSINLHWYRFLRIYEYIEVLKAIIECFSKVYFGQSALNSSKFNICAVGTLPGKPGPTAPALAAGRPRY